MFRPFIRTVVVAALPLALVGAGFAAGAGTDLGGDAVVPVSMTLATVERPADRPALSDAATGAGQHLAAKRTTGRHASTARKRTVMVRRPAAAAVPPGDPTLESQVVALVNRARAAKGCAAVRSDDRLRNAARLHSADMAAYNYFSHTGRNGSSFVDRTKAAGYSGAMAENIAWGYSSASSVMNAWMNSTGHRTNILNCSAVAIGVGVGRKSNGTLYWTQEFGRI